MTLYANLSGETHFLKRLTELFGKADPAIKQDGSQFILMSSRFSAALETYELLKIAREELAVLKGAARAYAGRSSVVVTGIVHNQERVEALLTLRGDVIQSSDFLAPKKVLGLAQVHKNVAEALQIYSEKSSWADLYKIGEIIRDDVCGGSKDLGEEALVKNKKFKSFMHNTQHGDKESPGRHARHETSPPKTSMTLSEGDYYIMELMDKWMRAKLAKL